MLSPEIKKLHQEVADLLFKHGKFYPLGGDRSPGNRVLEVSIDITGIPVNVYISAHEPPQTSEIKMEVPAISDRKGYLLLGSNHAEKRFRVYGSTWPLGTPTLGELQQYHKLVDTVKGILNPAPAAQ